MSAQTIDAAYKEMLYQRAREHLIAQHGSTEARAGLCYHWAESAFLALSNFGLRPIFQAGDMEWPMVTPEQDDGVSATHFSYIWSEKRGTTLSPEGNLPEIHIWLGLLETNEIVDFATGTLKTLAVEKHGMKWPGPPPPKFIWGAPPAHARYKPYKEATLFVYELLKSHVYVEESKV